MAFTAVSSIVLLTACGGGGGGSDDDPTSPPTSPPPTTDPPSLISPDEEVLRLFSDTSGDIADVIASNGPAIVAREVSEATWIETYDGSGSYRMIDGDFSIKADGNDLLVTIGEKGGAQYVYRIVDAASITESFVTIDTPGGDYFDLFINGGGTFADLFDSNIGSGYARRVGLYYSPAGEGLGYETRSVIGTETQDSMIAGLAALNATATYSGRAGINIRDANQGWPGFNGNLSGDLDLVANFGSGKISGSMNNLFLELGAGQTTTSTSDPAGSIRLDEAAIQKNAFAGTMSPDAVLSASDPAVATFAAGGKYSGAFYGPNAEEVGGTMTFDADVDGTRYLGIGNFVAD
jgi:hypothetical protein